MDRRSEMLTLIVNSSRCHPKFATLHQLNLKQISCFLNIKNGNLFAQCKWFELSFEKLNRFQYSSTLLYKKTLKRYWISCLQNTDRLHSINGQIVALVLNQTNLVRHRDGVLFQFSLLCQYLARTKQLFQAIRAAVHDVHT